MRIETKYNIGDKVFILEKIEPLIDRPCLYCEGHGVLATMDGNRKKCNRCNGNKTIKEHADDEEVICNTNPIVDAIDVSVWNDGEMQISYSLADDDSGRIWDCDECDVYATHEAASEAIKNRNTQND